EIIDAPAAYPAAALILRLHDEYQRPLHLRVVHTITELAERFERTGGDVGAAGIEHRIVIGERHLGEDFAVDVAIKCGPAAVVVLHRQEPAQAALDGGQAHP